MKKCKKIHHCKPEIPLILLDCHFPPTQLESYSYACYKAHQKTLQDDDTRVICNWSSNHVLLNLLSSINNQRNTPVNILFLLFVYFQIFFFLFGINKYEQKFGNMVHVEDCIMSIVCWNMIVFLRGGLSPGKQRTICCIFFFFFFFCELRSAMIRGGYKRPCKLACKIWSWHLEMPATPFSNVPLQMVLF